MHTLLFVHAQRMPQKASERSRLPTIAVDRRSLSSSKLLCILVTLFTVVLDCFSHCLVGIQSYLRPINF